MTVPILAFVLVAQSPQAEPLPPTVEEYLGLKDLNDVQVSPDGQAVAFTVTEPDLEASEYRTELYVWRSEGGARPATRRHGKVSRPRWSPDGDWLAFLSERDSTGGQIWLLPVNAVGDAFQLTEMPDEILDYGWSSDGSIYALTPERRLTVLAAIEAEEEGKKDDAVIVRDAAERRRAIYRVMVPDGESEHIWTGDRGIAEIAVRPDGRGVAFTTNYTGARTDYARYDLWVLDLESRQPRQLTDRAGSERSAVWSPDGTTLLFRATQNATIPYSQTELFEIAVGGGIERSLTEAFDRTVLDHRWPRGGRPMFTAALGTYTHVFVVTSEGAVERSTGGSHNYVEFEAGPGGTPVYAIRESRARGEELWRIAGAEPQQLTTLNAAAEHWRLGRQEVVRWTSGDGLSVEGLLVYPLDYEEGRQYPLLVNPHGGPSSRVRDILDQFHFYQLFAARGYAVLAPNFRGSIGYGEAFGTANREDLGGGDFGDLMAGVDHVIGLGLADSTRLGIYGGSYGGYMTNWAITQTARFSAAVSMYGIFNLITDYSNSNIPDWEPDYLGAYYWEDLDGYLDRSPMRHVSNVQTPVLIVHGSEDPNTFIANSNEMYRALSDLGRAVEFVKYPRERHGIREPRHRVDLFFRQLRWFDRYLKFGGTDLFDFYLVDEWVPGIDGWEMRAVSAEPRLEYAGTRPAEGRYLEVVLAFRADTAAAAAGRVGDLDLDLATDLALAAPADTVHPPAGTVVELFGQKTLLAGGLGSVQVPAGEGGPPPAIAIALAFEIRNSAGLYRLQVEGYAPVRIWVPRN